MKKLRGFTLVELMITLVIAVILLTIAVPSFITTIQNNRATAQANELVTALNLARSEAAKRGDSVSVCRSSDNASCSGGWSDGWMVFQDVNDDGNFDAGTDTVLQVWDGLQGNATLTATANFVTFDRLGAANTATTFTLTTPDCTGDQNRTISINATGKVNATRTACP